MAWAVRRDHADGLRNNVVLPIRVTLVNDFTDQAHDMIKIPQYGQASIPFPWENAAPACPRLARPGGAGMPPVPPGPEITHVGAEGESACRPAAVNGKRRSSRQGRWPQQAGGLCGQSDSWCPRGPQRCPTGTMRTGLVAWWTTLVATDPISCLLHPPAPPVPRTIMSASAPALMSSSAG
jgi:hypothetical protein